jgi:hypothetical protein
MIIVSAAIDGVGGWPLAGAEGDRPESVDQPADVADENLSALVLSADVVSPSTPPSRAPSRSRVVIDIQPVADVLTSAEVAPSVAGTVSPIRWTTRCNTRFGRTTRHSRKRDDFWPTCLATPDPLADPRRRERVLDVQRLLAGRLRAERLFAGFVVEAQIPIDKSPDAILD